MKNARHLLVTSAAFLVFASCNKPRSAPPGAGTGTGAEEIAAERALIEEERMELERQRLREERLALEEEKAALEAEREARLAAREQEVESDGRSLEERQLELAERERELAGREDELASREADLSEQELELAGRDILDDWEPEPLPEWQEPVADYGTFYEDLQPYGSWYETPDYGYVYQPTVVVQDRTWRPYTRGRWACTNLGWNWISDEPFGWACFHYGRWALLDGRGWVWVPGDEWAPSWVCWREGGDHVGWAPLPPETLCHRGRGWDGSVEAEFGIGALCFNFVHRRHMAEPLWRHCLPVEQNPSCLGRTNNITNIRYEGNRVVAGGPSYQRLRREIGKAWPVYRIETDRFEAIRDLNRRNATVRGQQIAVFAPNLNTRWNDRLKPSNIAGRWDDVKVVRAESGIKPEWTERFREMRVKRSEESKKPVDPVERKELLEGNRGKVAEAQRKLAEKQRQMSEARREEPLVRRESARQPSPSKPESRPEAEPVREPSLAERQRLAAERLREARARRTESPPSTGTATDEQANEDRAERIAAMREQLRQRELARKSEQNGNVVPANGEGEAKRPVLEKPVVRENRPSSGATRGDSPDQGRPVTENPRREVVRRQPEPPVGQDEPARPDSDQGRLRQAMEERRQQQQEQLRQRQEEARQAAEESERGNRMQEALRQQQEAARAKAEQAREEMAQRQRELEAARARQVEEARQRQELARREAEENQRRQQQEEMRRQQQEQARQQQEEMARRRQEEQAQRQEQMRQQQEEARRQAEERARQQQEERARQMEQARQQQEERARQQEQERQQREQEQQRRQEERAREQQERQEQSRQRGR